MRAKAIKRARMNEPCVSTRSITHLACINISGHEPCTTDRMAVQAYLHHSRERTNYLPLSLLYSFLSYHFLCIYTTNHIHPSPSPKRLASPKCLPCSKQTRSNSAILSSKPPEALPSSPTTYGTNSHRPCAHKGYQPLIQRVSRRRQGYFCRLSTSGLRLG